MGYELLADSHRRRVLVALTERESPPTVEELAAVLEGDSPRPVSRLVHVHLPVLRKAGILEYESPDDDLELTPIGQQFLEHVGSARLDDG